MGLKFFSRKNKEQDLKVKLTSSTKSQLDLAKTLEKNKEKANTDTFQRNLQNEINITKSLIKSANDLINDSMDIDEVDKIHKYKGKLQDQLVYLSKADRANKVSFHELTNKIKTIQENDPKKRIKELGASAKDFAMESAHTAGIIFGFMKPLLGILGSGFEKFLNKFPPMEFKEDDGYISKLLKNVFNGMRRVVVQLGNIFGGDFEDNSDSEDLDTLKDSLTKQKKSLVDKKNNLEFDEYSYKIMLDANNIVDNMDLDKNNYIENVKKLSKTTNEIKNKIKKLKLSNISDRKLKNNIRSRFFGNDSVESLLKNKVSLLDLIDMNMVSLDENNKVNILDKNLAKNTSFKELLKLKYLEYVLDRNIFYIMSKYDKNYANEASSDESVAMSQLMNTGFKNNDTFEFSNTESYYDEINSSTNNKQIASVIHINNMNNIFLNRRDINNDLFSSKTLQIKKDSTNNKIVCDQSVIKDYELKLKHIQDELNTINNDIQTTEYQIKNVRQQINTRNAKTTIEKKETISKELDSIDKNFYEINSNAKINIHLEEFMNSLTEDLKFESTTDYNDYDLYSTSDKRQGDKL